MLLAGSPALLRIMKRLWQQCQQQNGLSQVQELSLKNTLKCISLKCCLSKSSVYISWVEAGQLGGRLCGLQVTICVHC